MISNRILNCGGLFVKIVFVSLIVLLGCSGCRTDGKSGVPKEIYEVIFEKSDFAEPITLRLPADVDSEALERIKTGTFNLQPIFPPHLDRIHNKELREGLIKYGYIKSEHVTANVRGAPYTREILRYTEKIEPYIYECMGRRGIRVQLASRTLKSIDFKNRYKESIPFEGEIDFYAVRFSYTFEKNFPHYDELPIKKMHGYLSARIEDSLNDLYKGEAIAYLDPSFNEWKLERITLNP